jgi:hypothetical protein
MTVLRDLRARIARIEGFSPERQARVCPTGWTAVDAALPGGGLLAGALHEIHSDPPTARRWACRAPDRPLQAFAAGQAVLWASCRADLLRPASGRRCDPARHMGRCRLRRAALRVRGAESRPCRPSWRNRAGFRAGPTPAAVAARPAPRLSCCARPGWRGRARHALARRLSPGGWSLTCSAPQRPAWLLAYVGK